MGVCGGGSGSGSGSGGGGGGGGGGDQQLQWRAVVGLRSASLSSWTHNLTVQWFRALCTNSGSHLSLTHPFTTVDSPHLSLTTSLTHSPIHHS
jgi:hypothetical protein